MSYVLAIEPHQEQASLLRDNIGVGTPTRLTLVDSMDAAMTAIDDEVPDLVILNALIPPHEETRLVARLRALPQATAPQILFTPALARPETCQPRRTLVDRFRKRDVPPAGCNPSAFADQISAYLLTLPSGSAGSESAGSNRRVAARSGSVDWANVRIDGAVVDVVDLSLGGAQIVSSRVLPPGKSVQVWLRSEAEAIRCEAEIVWSGFEIIGEGEAPSVRAGINFINADRGALERLYVERNQPRAFRRLHTQKTEPTAAENAPSILRRPPDPRRPRAERRECGDVPWLSTVRLPWGVDARVLNISNTGMLLESGSRVVTGSVVELDLRGPEWTIAVQARFVRSEVASVKSLGVKYHVAAEFKRRFEFPESHRTLRENPCSSDEDVERSLFTA
jgi:CheY-like chemotaxis protein